MKKQLSHIDNNGNASMVDVTDKVTTARSATATGEVVFPSKVFDKLSQDGFLSKKGSIFQVAEIAGIQAVKKTADLIPLCHQLALSKIKIEITPLENSLKISCIVKCNERTGVEMEALTGVTIAALTIYDMCKALSHEIVISNIQLEQKTGGKNDYHR